MKIVLKPGGIAVVMATIIAGAALALSRGRARDAENTPPATTAIPIVAAKEVLVNGDFEAGFPPYVGVTATDTLNISGVIGKEWHDNSGWGKLDVRYDKETQNPHSGGVCQRIAVGTIRTGQNQFTQDIVVPTGTTLSGTVWIRSDTPLQAGEAEIIIRDKIGDSVTIATVPVTATTQWQSFTLQGTTTKPDALMLMLLIKRANVTVWVDDASVTATP